MHITGITGKLRLCMCILSVSKQKAKYFNCILVNDGMVRSLKVKEIKKCTQLL